MLTCEEMIPLMEMYYGLVDGVVIKSPPIDAKWWWWFNCVGIS